MFDQIWNEGITAVYVVQVTMRTAEATALVEAD
jgi:hypothetical protein